MKNFDWTSFTKRIAIRSSLPEIYEAWTVAANLEKWFLERVVFQDVDGNQLDYNEPVKGGFRYDWYWYLEATPMHGEIVSHHNIPQDDYSRQHIRLGCSNGWAFYLHNLKSVYEGGLDLRNKDPKLGVMINN
jgi:hypothetical protein